MSLPLISRVPFQSLFVAGVGLASRVAEDWRRWFVEVKAAIDATARIVGAAVALTAQAATLSASTGVLPAGLYRVSWLLLVTQAATTSSSLQVSVGATSAGFSTSQTGAALASPAAGAVQSGSVLVQVDPGTAISYGVAYASVGATPLQFGFSLVTEQIG